MPNRKKQPIEEESAEMPQTETGSESTEEHEGDSLANRVEELERELEVANSEKLRAIADFQNFRRRSQQEVQTFRRLATENLISELLPILDNFERTVQHLQTGADLEKMLQGVQAVERQLRSVLEGQGVRRIEALGMPFDPDKHEAVATETVEDEAAHDTVTTELEPGYTLGDRVIRPARVKVAKSA